ncbi:uncharacterized protein LOC129958048 [Argiope bruennichi]|uniref:Uncharacterized protein n=1 Tax=Argiope bruennichi TaxID=94029 RepID=A0A8T0F0I7_ARGBR|nr:uncharacterized protein LOC129958048 [Argiope bruennichi]KAF8784644.1 hypothetical protein HNY73_010295 [Argiope bruennichi]
MTKDSDNPYKSVIIVAALLFLITCLLYPWCYQRYVKPFFQKKARESHLRKRQRAAKISFENAHELRELDRREPTDSKCNYLDDVARAKYEMVKKYVESLPCGIKDDTDINLAIPFHVLRRSKSLNDLDIVMP